MEKKNAIKTAVSSFASRLLFLLSAPSCVSCGTLLGYGEKALCPACRARYEEHKARNCSLCSEPLCRCLCTGKLLDQNGVHTLVKVYRYRPQEENLPSNDCIYALKRRNRRDVFDFLADEVCDAVRTNLPSFEEFTLTYVPRRKQGVRRYGYDHAKELALAVSKRLGLEVVPTLVSNAKSEQKKMTVAERVKNASYRLRKPKASLPEKLFLVDDIVTSGASMSASAKELKRGGAKTVVGVSVAIAYLDGDAVRKNRKK